MLLDTASGRVGKKIKGQKHLDTNGALLARNRIMWKGRNNHQKNIVNPVTRLLASSKTPMPCSSQILLGSSQFLFTLKQMKKRRDKKKNQIIPCNLNPRGGWEPVGGREIHTNTHTYTKSFLMGGG